MQIGGVYIRQPDCQRVFFFFHYFVQREWCLIHHNPMPGQRERFVCVGYTLCVIHSKDKVNNFDGEIFEHLNIFQ